MLRTMDLAKFFEALRASQVFGVAITKGQVIGIESIIKGCLRHNVNDIRYVAAILSSTAIETGRIMQPIKETVMFNHKDKSPSDREVIRRLDKAFAEGKLPWVREPYWRRGAFGRGQIQVTHHENYVNMEKITGHPISSDYSRALEPKVSADIAVLGMMLGTFRKGHNLARYFNDTVEDPKGARRIVNGQDGKDDLAAKYYWAFKGALQAAMEDVKPVVTVAKKSWWRQLFGL